MRKRHSHAMLKRGLTGYSSEEEFRRNSKLKHWCRMVM
jgi:hypothetical protein